MSTLVSNAFGHEDHAEVSVKGDIRRFDGKG
jgi:hypothetical protein